MSRTADALRWLSADKARTIAQAALRYGISHSAISQARQKRSPLACPSCGAVFHLSDARKLR